MADPVAILKTLVAFRSDLVHGNERLLADHLAEMLHQRGADDVFVADVPRAVGDKPASWVYARFGRPSVLINAHLDTVPPNTDWSSDPLVPRIEGGRFHALGAADTKGAAAAILSALEREQPGNVGILFSGDEEYSSVAMQAFLESPHRAGLERAIVCEPTNLRVGTRHRGFIALEVTMQGPGGHSSLADKLPAPMAKLARLAVVLDDWALRHRTLGPPGFPGMCLNIARIDGGIAFNVIPAKAVLLFSLRPPPGADMPAICAELEAMAHDVVPEASLRYLRTNAPFVTANFDAFAPLVHDGEAPIDLSFWTEASMLSAAGLDAVVMGTGDIAQAHAPDEWVLIDELERARDCFVFIFAGS